MATISENLVLDLILDTSGYSKGLRRVERDSNKFANQVNRSAAKASKGFVGAFKRMRQTGQRTFSRLSRGARGLARGLGTVQVALAGIGIGLAVKELSAAASAFEEIEGKFTAVFKEGATEQRALIAAFGERVGRSTTDLLNFQATLQDTFVPLGIARKEAAKFADQVTKLGIDIASFNNKQDADVIRDLQSALVGNTETVRKYGIVINQARLNQELLNMGISGGVKSATEGEKALARLNLIMAGSTDAIGDAVRTANSFENSMKRIKAVVQDASVAFGAELNETILQTIEEMGGLDVILTLVKIAFKGVAEFGKLAVRVLGSYIDATGKVVGDSEQLEEILLGVEILFRRLEISVRTFLIPFGALAAGLVTIIGFWTLLGKTIFFFASTILKVATAGIVAFVSSFVSKFAQLAEAAQFITSAFGDNFLSDALGSAGEGLRSLEKSMQDFASSTLPTVEEVKAGFKDLGDTALEIGKTIANVAEVGVLSQTRGIAQASDAIGVLQLQQEIERKRRERAASRSRRRAPAAIAAPSAVEELETARAGLERGQGAIFIAGQGADVTGRFNRAGAAVGASVATPSPVSNVNESNVQVTIGEVNLNTSTPINDPTEAARILGEEISRQISRGQTAPFPKGPR